MTSLFLIAAAAALFSFKLGWDDTQAGLSGFRLYKIDANGNSLQVGSDIAPDLRQVTVFERKGTYVYVMTAFDSVLESPNSDPISVQVSKKGSREIK